MSTGARPVWLLGSVEGVPPFVALDASHGDGSAVVARFAEAVDAAVAQLRGTPESVLTEPRAVGRGKLPSTVIGLLVHAGDHTYRHVGQAITTARILAGVAR